MGSRGFWGLLVLVILAAAAGCERDDTIQVDRNRPPETYITQGPEVSPDPNDPTDLFYRAHLFWRGEDIDGSVVGFRFAIDDTATAAAWTFTQRTDSVFRFTVSEIGSREHLFLIRAVDNLGKADPSPDTLRFEAFTRSSPVARFETGKFIVNGAPATLSSGDTVAVFSDITFVWTGSDEDGEVVSWLSLFDTEQTPRPHERQDTTRTEVDLASGTHELNVTALDDAGARSTAPARFVVHSNLGTVTTFLPLTAKAKLARPWISPTDTLVVSPFDAGGVVVDTIPSFAVFEASWSSVDPDTDIRSYNWFFNESQGRVNHPTTTASTLLNPASPNVGAVNPQGRFYVVATDVFGQVERPRITYIPIGMHCTCTFVNEDEGIVPINQLYRFEFTRDDEDSDPNLMRYEYQFLEYQTSTETIGPLAADSLAIVRAFTASDTLSSGVKRLKIRGIDITGLTTASAWDTVIFRLGPPESAAVPGEAVRPAWTNEPGAKRARR